MVLGQLLLVIPGHPGGGIGRQFGGVALQLAEVVEGIGSRQFARVDQAHEQIAHFGAVHCAIEQRIITVMEIFPYSMCSCHCWLP